MRYLLLATFIISCRPPTANPNTSPGQPLPLARALPRAETFLMDDGASEGTAGRASAPPEIGMRLRELVAEQNAALGEALDPLADAEEGVNGTFEVADATIGGRQVALEAVVTKDETQDNSWGTSVTVKAPGEAPASLGVGFFSEADSVVKAGFRLDMSKLTGEGAVAFSSERGPAGSLVQARLDGFRAKGGSCPNESSTFAVHRVDNSARFPGHTVVLVRAAGSRNLVETGAACERELLRVRRVVGVGGFGRALAYGGDIPAGKARLLHEAWRAETGVVYRQSYVCPFDLEQRSLDYPSCLPSDPRTQPNLDAFTQALREAWGQSDTSLASLAAREGDPIREFETITDEEAEAGIISPSEVPNESSDVVLLEAVKTAGDPVDVGTITDLGLVTPGMNRRTLESGGLTRTYLLYVPSNYQAGTRLPLVLILHGGGGDAGQMVSSTQMNIKADAEGFFVAYLNGTDTPRRWNTGIMPNDTTVDDVGYVRDVVQKIETLVSVDAHRVYAAGYSNGSKMTHRLGAELPHLLAAVATITGTVGVQWDDGVWHLTSTPLAPIPIMITHGLNDSKCPYQGGYQASEDVYIYSAYETAEFWKTANGCTGSPQQATSANGNTETLIWSSCMGNAKVRFNTVKTGEHQWMSTTNVSNFPATDAIWGFFSQHALP